ncbi:uncharacterized protein LOC128987112 isoform X2 [Macrosteles quadrilineatus]|uniref:uncharacterized protein LOC128987112 isoform X2 n=1 Tax=Macrosteles quadrilineatus TaxID=74068 RepID=UPI0023E10B64|nr:uncharacterized protein LOC128987112 isoform X2 [Macrosteles quadrilineatus]
MSFCDGDRSQQSGNYDVQITYIGSCGQNGNYSEQMGFVQTRMSKTNRTYACLSGIFALPYGLSDDMQETWELFVKGSTGGWKRFITFNNKKACSDKRRLYPKWFKMLNIKDVPCPIPRGNYTVDCDRAAGWKFSQAKTLTYGEYKAIVNFYHNKENIGCTDFRANIVPMADEIQ